MDDTSNSVVLLTDIFPNLVGNEYGALRDAGVHVRVYAHVKESGKKNDHVFEFGRRARFRFLFRGTLFFVFSGEVFSVLRFSGKNMFRAAKTAIHWAANALYQYSEVEKNETVAGNRTVYAYWSDSLGLTAALFAKRKGQKALVRMHGWDLYAERHTLPYLPYRRFLNRHLDRIVFISEHGHAYYAQKYPEVAPKLSVNRLGTPNPAPRAEKGPALPGLRLASCSHMIPLKRNDLILRTVKQYGDSLSLHWTHLGGGELYGSTREEVKKNGLENRISLKGPMENADIHAFYAQNNVDIFLNVSETEGLPVSIMEAMSYGIPVIATAVGGTPEIVKDGYNGFILDPNPTTEQIAAALKKFMALGEEEKKRMSENAYATWAEGYSAERNFGDFIKVLERL